MVRYREILRLTALGISQRGIAGSVGCSKTTVQEVQRKAASLRLGWPLPDEMGDEALRARLYPPQDRSDATKAEIDHEWVQREMGRRGVTMTLLWNEYAERAVLAGRTPYMYSSFCHRHQRWVDANPEVAMHVEWRPGEWCQVGWRGDTMRVCDPDTGELLKAYVFVADLPFSAYIYAEAFYRMDERAWVEGHVHAFADFGGSTPLVAPDNLKTGVTRNTIDRLIVNEQYRRMLEHYGCATVPTRVRRPRDKGGVEGAVLIVERQAITAQLKATRAQESLGAGLRKAEEVARELETSRLADAARVTRGGVAETLTYARFPMEHWRRIRTNNGIERLNREVKRRTNAVGSFPDGRSVSAKSSA